MKSIKKVLIAILLLMMIIPSSVSAVDVDNLTTKKTTMDFVNDIRKKYGVKTLTSDKNLDNASLKHSTYMFRNDLLESVEDSTKKNYTAKYPWDRAKANYYLKPYITEIIDSNENTYVNSLRNFIDNPYTRITFLDPKSTHYSVAAYGEYITHMIGGEDLNYEYTKKVTYPYDGQTDVPTTWKIKNNIVTNPYRNFKDLPLDPGYPITFTYYSSEKVTKMRVITAETELYNTKREEKVDCDIFTPDTDKYLTNSNNTTNTILVLPKKLEKNTEYRLTIKVEIVKDNKSEWIKETVYFSTEKENGTDLKAKDNITRGEFAEKLVKGLRLPLANFSKTGFKDVNNSNRYAQYIVTAVNYGLMAGVGNDMFDINGYLTREQIVTIIVRAEENLMNNGRELEYDGRTIFNDMYKVSPWAVVAVKKAYSNGLLMGTGNNMVTPDKLITKEESELFILRIGRR